MEMLKCCSIWVILVGAKGVCFKNRMTIYINIRPRFSKRRTFHAWAEPNQMKLNTIGTSLAIDLDALYQKFQC
jgi:hypothetical protein